LNEAMRDKSRRKHDVQDTDYVPIPWI